MNPVQRRRPFVYLVNLVALCFVAACASSPSTPVSSPDSVTGKQLQGAGQGPDVNPNAPTSNPADCNFKAGAACFSSAEEACRSLGCEVPACDQLETHPVQVQCKK